MSLGNHHNLYPFRLLVLEYKMFRISCQSLVKGHYDLQTCIIEKRVEF